MRRKKLAMRPIISTARAGSFFWISTVTAFSELNRKCGLICMRSVCSCCTASVSRSWSASSS